MFTTEIRGRQYRLKPYAFDECVTLQLMLGVIMGAVAGPGVEFAAALFTVGDDGKYVIDPTKTDKASGESLGRAVSNLPAGIIAAGGPKFVRRLLALTEIQVPNLAGKGEDQFALLSSKNPGAEGDWFDAIYTGGNSAELYLALGWVITANFSPFGRAPSWTWSALSGELTKQIPQLLKLSIQTPTSAAPSDDTAPDNQKPTG